MRNTVTSTSKKPGQNVILYHYCGLSRFFLNQTLRTYVAYVLNWILKKFPSKCDFNWMTRCIKFKNVNPQIPNNCYNTKMWSQSMVQTYYILNLDMANTTSKPDIYFANIAEWNLDLAFMFRRTLTSVASLHLSQKRNKIILILPSLYK